MGNGKEKKVLVTGAGGPASINFIRSLHLAPEKISIIGTEANEYSYYLSPAERIYLIPRADSPGFIDALNEIIRKEKIDFLHAQTDPEVKAVSENREKVAAAVFLPSKKTVEICQDKLEATRIWMRKGVPVAKGIELRNENDISRAFEELGSQIWIRASHGAGGRGSTPANNVETAVAWFNYWKGRGVNWKFFAQEHLPGRNYGFHSLWKDGELIVSMARERLEYIYPHLAPSGVTGTPASQKTVHIDMVNKIATEAILAIDPNFNGIACVDLKENKEGIPCVTEINAGRMFTTSFFFSFASKIILGNYHANIPYLYVRLGLGESIPTIQKYNILPADIYWIRHIDAPARLVMNGKVIGEMYYFEK